MHQDLRALGRLQKNDFENAQLNARRHSIIDNIFVINELWMKEQNDETNPTAPQPSAEPSSSDTNSLRQG
jgi:hypothetical protein